VSLPERIGVLGAGTMGAGIAQVALEAGLDVAVLDPVDGAYDRARDRIGGFLERKVAKAQLGAGAADAAMARLTESGSIADLAATGFVVEAIPEDLDLKRDAFRRLSAAAPTCGILATNTRPCRSRKSPWPPSTLSGWSACTSSTRCPS
jgi:3-hydroxybutyryl-CoA dehydrogenase